MANLSIKPVPWRDNIIGRLCDILLTAILVFLGVTFVSYVVGQFNIRQAGLDQIHEIVIAQSQLDMEKMEKSPGTIYLVRYSLCYDEVYGQYVDPKGVSHELTMPRGSVEIESSGAEVSRDAGVLSINAFDWRIGWTLSDNLFKNGSLSVVLCEETYYSLPYPDFVLPDDAIQDDFSAAADPMGVGYSFG